MKDQGRKTKIAIKVMMREESFTTATLHHKRMLSSLRPNRTHLKRRKVKLNVMTGESENLGEVQGCDRQITNYSTHTTLSFSRH